MIERGERIVFVSGLCDVSRLVQVAVQMSQAGISDCAISVVLCQAISRLNRLESMVCTRQGSCSEKCEDTVCVA